MITCVVIHHLADMIGQNTTVPHIGTATGARRGINVWREKTAESTLHQYQQMSHALRNKPPYFNT
jgi:hypothetical protein